MIVALALAAAGVSAKVDAVATEAKLAGVVLVAKGDTVLIDKGFGTIKPGGRQRHRAGARWRLASITKQVVAARIMQRAAAPGMPANWLDLPLAEAVPLAPAGNVTLRQLLTHHSGLANPDTTPADKQGVPAFYRQRFVDMAYCTSKAPAPGGPFSYNNCDYLIAGLALLSERGPPRELWPRGMAMAAAGEKGVPGFVRGRPEPAFELSSYYTSAGLIGTARDVFRFDRALMTGKLLPPAALAELWRAEGGNSYQALGQWVYPARLKGCTGDKRIVQRDGEILGVQTRNFILPDDEMVVVVFTNRSSDDFQFGELWQGKGFAYDLLSAVVCG